MEFRIARAEDIEKLGTLKVEAFLAKATGCCTSREKAEAHVLDTYRTKQPWSLENCAIVVRTSDNAVLGSCQLKYHGQDGMMELPGFARHSCEREECYLETICVSEEARGQGVGTMLLNWADETARSNGCTVITLDVAVNLS